MDHNGPGDLLRFYVILILLLCLKLIILFFLNLDAPLFGATNVTYVSH